jgi:hypothetical protein
MRMLQEHNSDRSHLLMPGIASFSMMIGRSSTISRNHVQKPITQKRVERRIENLGGAGKGFDRDRSLVTLGSGECGTGGSGFERFAEVHEGAVRPLLVASLGGTGGGSVSVCALRLRTL